MTVLYRKPCYSEGSYNEVDLYNRNYRVVQCIRFVQCAHNHSEFVTKIKVTTNYKILFCLLSSPRDLHRPIYLLG